MSKAEYESKAKITKISAISRASVKIRDSFYTVEYGEERAIPEGDVNIEQEREMLWADVNYECDKQIDQIIQEFKSKR